jgi:hypothetical protein
MRYRSLALASILVALIALISQSVFGQSPMPVSAPAAPAPPAVARDAQALATVQSAIAAMGGAGAVAAIQDATVQGTILDQPSDGSSARSFTWMSAGSQFRTQITTGTGTRIYVSGNGSPVDQENGVSIPVPSFVAQANLPYELPALVLLNELNNPNYTISYVSTQQINGNPAIHIHTCDDTDFTSSLVTPQDWYFDTISGLPVRVEYKLPQDTDAQHPLPLSIDFANFKSASGVLVPYQLTMNEGPVVEVATVTSVALNSGLSSSTFAAPSGSAQ